MKRCPVIIVFVLIGISLVQCKPKRDPNKTYFDKPSEYNDFIVLEQKEVMASFDDLAEAINKGNTDSMVFYRESLCKRTQLAEASVARLADYKEDTLFRFSALELFRYINYACEHELKEIIEIAAKDSAITDADVEQIHTLSQSYTIQEKEKNDALIAAQEKFAKKFNVVIK